jgi:hypothetical protein
MSRRAQSLAQFARSGFLKPGMRVTGEEAASLGFRQFRESFAAVLAKKAVAAL